VAVVEQEVAGYGASGRNAGIVGETLDHSHELAVEHFGLEEARRLARLGRENLDGLEAFLREAEIDAEFRRPGQLFVALTPRHLRELEAALAAARAVGIEDWRVLGREEVRAELDSPLYLGALLAPRAGLVHPIKLVDGLAGEIRRRGARLFERSRVERIVRSKAGVEIRTAGGVLRARRAALATNAYSAELRPRLSARFLPLYDYVLVSEPLSRGQWDLLGWKSGRGVTDARAFFNYYRPTSDGRVLWGTSEAVYYPGPAGVGPAHDHSPAHYTALAESFGRHFPQLASVEFPFAWGGPIASTTRLTPFFGSEEGGRLVYGLGYTGHGIGSSRIAGEILAHLLLDKPGPLLDLAMVRRKPVPYPPGPSRRLAVAAVTRALRRVDAGAEPGLLLKVLKRLRIGFSS
jgi:glycine/D-amino acid oxidase-like deaminating enzyme